MNNTEVLLTDTGLTAEDVKKRIHQVRTVLRTGSNLLAVEAHNKARHEANEDGEWVPRVEFDEDSDPALDAALERQDFRHMEAKDEGR